MTSNEKQKAFRARKLKAGQKKRDLYLTDKEYKDVKLFIKLKREAQL